ncbi:MAG: PQQ-binding-like beta-propeller repeat protein [Gammaproteobacteria bacterium]|nr:PQQ-binding-like beta-propeller repeat protein [Gammaproteobacteria bacterium]MBU1447278.1 PQQ-binding-like beta-propeller repeat protein [Gammaproteobacteria bacterium]
MENQLKYRSFVRPLLSLAISAIIAFPQPSLAASVALANAPLATSTSSAVKPNVMFILDDSGSMGWDYLPDWANDTDPASSGSYPSARVSYTSVPALFRNNQFNGIAYNPAITYSPPVLYNADGTLNTTTYPNIGSPWTSVKNDAFGVQSTNSTNLVTSFPDVEFCTDSNYTDCLRNDNLLLPGTVNSKNYSTKHTTTSSSSGNVATGAPDAPTTAARSFGPFYYTTVPGEYCDSANLTNCQTTQTSTFSYPATLRWCDSSALTNCRAINDSTYKYPRYPTLYYSAGSPLIPAQPAHGPIDAVPGVAASASFTFNYSGTVNPIGFSIKVNGTEMLTATTPNALLSSWQLANWVQTHYSLAGYFVSVNGSTVTITANTTGTAYNINSLVITETPGIVTAITTPSFVSGVDSGTAIRPTGLISFGGTTTSSSNSAIIDDDISGKSVYVGGTSAENNAITIGKSKTPSQAAAAVVSEIGTGNSIKAYVGGNTITPLCAAQSSNVVCLVDTTTYSNGRDVRIGTTYNFSGLTVSTTATDGGNNGTGVKAVGQITFDYAGSLNPTGYSIKINGTEMLTATTPGAITSASSMDNWVVSNSSLANYVITNTGSTVIITAAAVGTAWNINSITLAQDTPASATTTTPTYVAGVDEVLAQPAAPATPEIPAVPAGYYGRFIRTDIVPTINSYPYPGSATKANTRTDCAGTTCTYNEEMTNFANWWTYYHTRLQAMKTSVSRAFKSLDNRFRVGFSTISSTNATDGTTFLGNNTFELTHKNRWFTKLFATDTSGSTPLRGALSKAGRYYGDKISGQVDPVQYSCQQNFAILSTDGYWNTGDESSSYTALGLTGSLVGDLDGGTTPRPMKQGTTAVSNTLADIAKYYYDTDLRTSTLNNCTGGVSSDYPSGNSDVCTNNVFTSSTDNNIKQHMTTFTMGLGIDGTLNYTSDYLTATSGDYYNLKNGLGTPTVNWSDPINNSAGERIDDLWHAAVNGQGIYFSAKDPDQIITGFNTALSSITAKLGAAAAAATSTLNPVAGNNFAYVASYTTNVWKGNLESRSINVDTGVVSESATWCVENVTAATCASPGTIVADTSGSSTIYNCVVSGATSTSCTSPGVFDSATSECKTEIQNACTGTMASKVSTITDTRTIYTANSTGTALIPFDAAYATANPTYFSAAHINGLNQWGTLTATQRIAAEGVNLLNYLRGQNGYEDRASNLVENRLYRTREAVLGDALESQPAFIANPVFNYPYLGYSDFKTAQAARAGTVYMGTNDGMMHAFNASNGSERWAYVPSMVIPNMWKLASTSYSNNHTNYVNGSPLTTDICTANCNSGSAVWKTVLVGGLNGGGRGYYALDITNPDAPALMWEFTPADDSDLGYSFGVPVITKKDDGTWVVLVTSGYDNGTLSANPLVSNSPTGSGVGYLYVLDAATGSIISKISTGAGSAATPSGLAKIAAWNAEGMGNKASYVYGGDLLGNLWRFDINDTATTATIGTGSVILFASLYSDVAGISPQPITTTPVLGQINDNRVVYIGTGKYLESSDLTTTQVQSQYAIMDDNTGLTLVNPRNSLTPRTLSNDLGTATRTGSSESCTGFTGRGWYVDFPDSKERVNIDSKLVQGTLLTPTIVPSNTVCSPGGYGWLNFFDYKTGCAVDTSTGLSAVKYDSTIVGVNIIYIGGEPVVSVVTSTNPTPEQPSTGVPFSPDSSHFAGKRMIWREWIP